jgi:predicted nucleotidyltransferase
MPKKPKDWIGNEGEDEMKTLSLSRELQHHIVSALQTLNPYKIILFGSYAYGKPNADSDIDLLFVNSDEDYKNFSERMAMKVEILKKLDQISQPIDVLAYTKKEWEDLLEKNSSFIREINEKGILLEAAA